MHDLEVPNEDGVSILFYLQKIFPGSIQRPFFLALVLYSCDSGLGIILIYVHSDEWNNFRERMKWDNEEDVRGLDEALEENLRLWASYRGQTLTKTGMKCVYYIFVATFFLLLITGRQAFSCIFTCSFVLLSVRGMMYYRKALELQAFLDMAKDEGIYNLLSLGTQKLSMILI